MPDLLAEAFAIEGFYWLVLTIFIAGIVRGFSGFGSALIFVPVAGLYLPPSEVVALITILGIASSTALLPRAWGQADKTEISILVSATLVAVPMGVAVMAILDAIVVRWIVAAVAGATLVALVTGWRYHGRLGTGRLLGVGGVSGLVGGLTGMAGPAMILFYLANGRSAVSVRGNAILFLAITDLVIVTTLVWKSLISAEIFVLGAVLAVPYVTTTLIGQAAFRPSHEQAYRVMAYSVIALAVIAGLPIWN